MSARPNPTQMRAISLAVATSLGLGSCSADPNATCKEEDIPEVLFLQTIFAISNGTYSQAFTHGARAHAFSRFSEEPHASAKRWLSLLGAEAVTSREGAVNILGILLLIVCLLIVLSLFASFISDSPGPRADASGRKLLEEGAKGAGKGEVLYSAAPSMAPSMRVLPPRGSTSSPAIVEAAGGTEPRPSLPPTAGTMARYGSAPPICPSLILPVTEARFMISMDSLRQLKGSVGPIDITGQSGKKLLHGTLEDHGAERRLSIASVNCAGDPRAVVIWPGEGSNHYMIYGRQVHGDTATLRLYGVMEYVGSKLILSVGPQWMDPGSSRPASDVCPVMSIDTDHRGEMLLAASSIEGARLAGSDVVVAASGTEGWRLIVRPGEDAILVLSCMLVKLLLPSPAWSPGARMSLPGVSPKDSYVPPMSSFR